MRKHLATIAAALLLIGGSAEAGQSEDIDSRWVPWLGCWQLWEEELEALNASGPVDDTDRRALMERTSVCVRPSGPGVTVTASEGERLLVERRIMADGNQHEVIEADCRGWEQNEWSRDGHRLFTTAEIQCGDMPTRRLSGISLLASASSWVDIQFVEMGQHQQLEVRRYSPIRAATEADAPLGSETLGVDPSEIRQARRESAEAPKMPDIMEASGNTTPRVVEALLVETEPKLHLDSQALVGLDDAGIDHGVIDLLVAQSYPEEFVVERRDRGGTWSSRSGGGYGGFGGFYDPVWYSDLYPYYITPLGSRYLGSAYNPYLYGSAVASPFVILANPDVDQSAARAVKGRGYTRVLPRAVGTPRAVGRQRAPSGSGGTTARTGSSGGSGGTTASPGGYSGGRSGTGRRAVPRQ